MYPRKELVSVCSTNISEVRVTKCDSKICSSLNLHVQATIKIPLDVLEQCNKLRKSALICLQADSIASSTEVLRLCKNSSSSVDKQVTIEKKNGVVIDAPVVTVISTNIKMKVSCWELDFNEHIVNIGVSLEGPACFYSDKYDLDFAGDVNDEYVILLQVHFDRVLTSLQRTHKPKKRKIDDNHHVKNSYMIDAPTVVVPAKNVTKTSKTPQDDIPSESDGDDHIELVICPPSKPIQTASRLTPPPKATTALSIAPVVTSTSKQILASHVTASAAVTSAATTTRAANNRTPAVTAPAVTTTPVVTVPVPPAIADNFDPTVIQAKTADEYKFLTTRLERLQRSLANNDKEYRTRMGQKNPIIAAFADDFIYPPFEAMSIRIRIVAYTFSCKETYLSPSLTRSSMEKNIGFLQAYEGNNQFAVFFPISGNTLPIPKDDILFVYNVGAKLPPKRIPSVLFDIYGTALPRAFKKVNGESFRSDVIANDGLMLLRCIHDDYKFHLCQVYKVAGMSDFYVVKYFHGNNHPTENSNANCNDGGGYSLAELHNNVLFHSDVNTQQRGLITGTLAEVLKRNKGIIGYTEYYNMLEHFL